MYLIRDDPREEVEEVYMRLSKYEIEHSMLLLLHWPSGRLVVCIGVIFNLNPCKDWKIWVIPTSTEKTFADIGQYIAGQSKSMQTGELVSDLEATKIGESNKSQGSSSKKTTEMV
jgi:hypothetical protein